MTWVQTIKMESCLVVVMIETNNNNVSERNDFKLSIMSTHFYFMHKIECISG